MLCKPACLHGQRIGNEVCAQREVEFEKLTMAVSVETQNWDPVLFGRDLFFA